MNYASPANTEITLRELTPEDAPAFFAVRLTALETHPEAFSSSAELWKERSLDEVQQRLHDHCVSNDQLMLGAFHGTTLVGIMGLFRETYPKLRHKATVVAVYVAPEWRGKGVAGRLLDEIILNAKKMPGLEQLQLGVGTYNLSAVRLYESRGFRVFGTERHAMLVDGKFIDEAMMQLFLTS